MNTKRTLILVVLCIIQFASAGAQTKKLAPQAPAPKVRSEMLVSTDWLSKHGQENDVLILHVGGDKADFDAGHVPGARHLLLKDFIKNEPGGLPNELPSPEELKKSFEAVGVTDRSHVILYANDTQTAAARAYFTLDYIGQADHASLLDGGMEKWLSEKRPLSTETLPPKPGSLTLRVNPGLVAAREQVEKAGAETVLVDARPLYRYRAGHIPGASSLYWEKYLASDEDPKLRASDDLRKQLAAAGVTSDKKLVVYCDTGMQASFAYFVAKYLGYDPVNYDGSFSDWKAQKKPMVKGDQK